MPSNPPRLAKAVEQVVDNFGFEFSEPPPKQDTRRGKHDDRFEAAREVAMRYPGKTLKVITYNSASNAYNVAKSINNSEHRIFPDGNTNWTAVAGKDGDNYALWLTYRESE